LETLEIGALLHDIGKIGVSDVVLRKPGELTADEYSEMQHHPVVGAQMLEGVSILRPMLPYILFHQEHYNGKGYPFGLAGTAIPLEGRILAVADTFDAMTSTRPYRKRMSVDEAIEEIVRNRGTQFDPEAVDALLGVHKKGRLLPLIESQGQKASNG
jgi:HD-GYP domain-containing protein (c-di-GMP phosphodiesterase class II)